jgi:hypothetical protein
MKIGWGILIFLAVASHWYISMQLKDYLASGQSVYAITTRKRLARLPFRPYVFARQGDKFIISNKRSP